MRALLVVCFLSSAAHAWDGTKLWNNSATAAMDPGGGGIYGTGGARDYNITCADCHVKRADGQGGKIDLKLTFSPALVAGAYTPGQKYNVTAELVGQWLGRGFETCGQYLAHFNQFAAAFENASGNPVGVLATDNGVSSASCPSTWTMTTTGTTALYGDCHAIVSKADGMSDEDRSSWTFSWTAPAAGTGTVTVYFGAVDGDCDMMSMGDDVKVGTLRLGEATASRASTLRYAWLIAFILLVWRRRALFIFLAFTSSVACSKPATGSENGACYGNDTCNPGLFCVAKVCVQPPMNDGSMLGDGASPDLAPAGDLATRDMAGPTGDLARRNDAGMPCPGADIFHPGSEPRSVNTSVQFVGRARDAMCNEITGSKLVWTDSLEGQIGTGQMFNHTFTMTGMHTVTLTATDSVGNMYTATVTFLIQ